MSSAKKKIDWRQTWRVYRRLLGYLRPYRWVGVGTMLGMAGDAAGLTLFVYLIRPMIDRLFVDKDPKAIFWLPIYILGIAVVRGVASYFGDYGMGLLARSVVKDIRKDVFASYLRVPMPFFTQEASGHQISRITYTSDQVAKASTTAFKSMVQDGLMAIGMVFNMLYASAYLTLALLVLVPTLIGVVSWISRRYRRISRRVQNTMGSVAGIVREAVDGSREVRIYGAQRSEQGRFDDLVERTARFNLKITSTAALSGAMVQTTAAAVLAVIIWLATRPWALQHISAGTFTGVIFAMTGLVNPLKRLTNVQSDIQRGVAAAEELFETMDLPPEHDEGRQAMGRALGDIRFEGVGLTYENASGSALRGIDLHCPPGRVTALVGRSGSGKTSLAACCRGSTCPAPAASCSTATTTATTAWPRCAGRSPGWGRAWCCSTAAWPRTSPTARWPVPARPTSSPRPRRPTRWVSSTNCPRASTPASARTAACFPAASASASRSHARSSRTRRS